MRRRLSRRHRASGERGTALVEFAIIVPLLAAVLFGIIEFGSAYNDYQSLRQGNRDAIRQAVVADLPPATCTPTGSASSANASTKSVICMTKDRVGLDASRVSVAIALGTNGYKVGEAMTVCVQYRINPVTKLFPMLNNKVITSKVQMRIEKVASPSIAAVSENSQGGTFTCAVA